MNPSQIRPGSKWTQRSKEGPAAAHDFSRLRQVDVKSGSFRLYTEMAAADGKFKGYAKPLLENLKFSI